MFQPDVFFLIVSLHSNFRFHIFLLIMYCVIDLFNLISFSFIQFELSVEAVFIDSLNNVYYIFIPYVHLFNCTH